MFRRILVPVSRNAVVWRLNDFRETMALPQNARHRVFLFEVVAKIGEWLAHFQAYVILCTEHIVVFVLVEGHR